MFISDDGHIYLSIYLSIIRRKYLLISFYIYVIGHQRAHFMRTDVCYLFDTITIYLLSLSLSNTRFRFFSIYLLIDSILIYLFQYSTLPFFSYLKNRHVQLFQFISLQGIFMLKWLTCWTETSQLASSNFIHTITFIFGLIPLRNI